MTQTPPLSPPKPSPDGPPKPSPDGPPKPSPDGTPTSSRVVSTKPALSSPWWSKPWRCLGVGLALAAIAYGVGRMQGGQALTSAEQQHAIALETARSELETVRANLEVCGIDRSLLSARRSLALVALSLDRRNFGVAESHRREASQTLEQPRLSGLPEVGSMATTIGALDLSVDPDPGAKRGQVIVVSEVLDRLLATRDQANVPSADTPAKVPQ